MRPRTTGGLAGCIGGVVAAALVSVFGAGTATAAVSHTPKSGPYYVAVGASESVGVQPSPTGVSVRTDRGYANDLTAMEQARWPGLRLADFGCPGITAVQALHGRSTCSYPAGSEVATAVAFMRAHRGRVVLATVDLGFNDVRRCVVHRKADAACAKEALRHVARTMPRIVAELRAAGGSRLEIVGLLHADPYRADYLLGRQGRVTARWSATVMQRLNDVLAATYASRGVLVANVPSAFDTSGRALVRESRYGTVPTGVARACALTWMCTKRNLHPNAAGYRVMADAIAATIALGSAVGPSYPATTSSGRGAGAEGGPVAAAGAG